MVVCDDDDHWIDRANIQMFDGHCPALYAFQRSEMAPGVTCTANRD